ncbi:MAG: hypothetical protein K6C11_02865 [Bacilli bacterium]|nr:hypothetical protein [Bacilli bacterium]
MKGKINVTCVIGKEFNTGDLVVTTKAVIENKEGNVNFGKGYANVVVKPRFDLSFETLQIIAAKKNMLSHLEDKGGIVFKDLPAEFIYAKAQNEDRWYHAVIVDLGTPDYPVKRTFYLNQKNEYYLSLFTPEYEFTKTDSLINDSAEAEETE